MATPELRFLVGGGPHLTFDYRIVGGAFDGCRVTLAPVRNPDVLAYGRRVASDPEEWDRTLGPAVRPTATRLSGQEILVHGSAVMDVLAQDPETLAAVQAELAETGR